MTSESRIRDGTSLSLLERIKANDQRAWDRLVLLYGRLVFYWCQRAGVREADIPDLVQEVFQAVFRHIGTFERQPEHGSFRGWLRTVTMNKLRDQARRDQKGLRPVGGTSAHQRLLQVAEASPPDAEDAMVNETNLLVEQVLSVVESDFSPTTWQAFRMAMFDHKTSPEVAEQLGMTANAVRHAKARVLRRLRQELEGLFDFPEVE